MDSYDDANEKAEAEFASFAWTEELRDWRDCLEDLLDAYLKLHKNFKGLPEQEGVVIRARAKLRSY